MKMFVIEDKKKDKVARGIEQMLHIGGMLMQQIENLEECEEDEEEYGERDWDPDYPTAYGERGRMGMRAMNYGNRYSSGKMVDDNDMGMRRRRR